MEAPSAKASSPKIIPLSALSIGHQGRIQRICCEPAMQRRLSCMGFVPNTLISCVGSSAHNDPRAYFLRGCMIALRSKDAQNIFIQEVINFESAL